MLSDILNFASDTLIPDGTLQMWMPTANDEDKDLDIPRHERLEVTSNCVQDFNKCKSFLLDGSICAGSLIKLLGSRRLITYRRLRDGEVSSQNAALATRSAPGERSDGIYADDLNVFRRKVCHS